jgi:hypothetical protein
LTTQTWAEKVEIPLQYCTTRRTRKNESIDAAPNNTISIASRLVDYRRRPPSTHRPIRFAPKRMSPPPML